MNNFALPRLAVAVLLGAATLDALALARTYVASYGLDTNPCTRAAPCRNLSRAYTQTDAGGELVILDSSRYGRLTIARSISVIAPEGVRAEVNVAAGQHGIVVNAPNLDVALRGLTVRGYGGNDGIRIESARNVFIEKAVIEDTGNVATLSAGIHIASGASGARVFVTDTAVRRTSGHGVAAEASATVVVDRSRIESSLNAGILGDAPAGRLSVSNSFITGNQDHGIRVFSDGGGTWYLDVARSIVEGNSQHGIAAGNGVLGTYRITVSDSVLRGNSGYGLFVNPAVAETSSTLAAGNRIVSNIIRGISCGAEGSATLVAERNEVVGSGVGLHQSGNCSFRSMANNVVENNFTNTVGTITPMALF